MTERASIKIIKDNIMSCIYLAKNKMQELFDGSHVLHVRNRYLYIPEKMPCFRKENLSAKETHVLEYLSVSPQLI